MRTKVRSLASPSGLRIAVSCGVGHRCTSDPALLWLWHRMAATALFRPLAWGPTYAVGAGLKIQKDQKKKKKRQKKKKKKKVRKLLNLFSLFARYLAFFFFFFSGTLTKADISTCNSILFVPFVCLCNELALLYWKGSSKSMWETYRCDRD